MGMLPHEALVCVCIFCFCFLASHSGSDVSRYGEDGTFLTVSSDKAPCCWLSF